MTDLAELARAAVVHGWPHHEPAVFEWDGRLRRWFVARRGADIEEMLLSYRPAGDCDFVCEVVSTHSVDKDRVRGWEGRVQDHPSAVAGQMFVVIARAGGSFAILVREDRTIELGRAGPNTLKGTLMLSVFQEEPCIPEP